MQPWQSWAWKQQMPIRGPVPKIQQSQWTQWTHLPQSLPMKNCPSWNVLTRRRPSHMRNTSGALQRGWYTNSRRDSMLSHWKWKWCQPLIREFKTTVAKMYDLVHCTDRKEIWNSIKDPEGKCLWVLEDDVGDQATPAEATVQQEQHAPPKAEEFIQGWDEPSPMNRLC